MSDPNWIAIKKDIGDKVSKGREKSGLSLEKFSIEAGVSKEVLHRIERGRTLASTRTLAKIAHFLKTKISRMVP